MAAEKQLIEKNFYQTLLKENETKHPIQLLGELFQEEQKRSHMICLMYAMLKEKYISTTKIMKRQFLNGKI